MILFGVGLVISFVLGWYVGLGLVSFFSEWDEYDDREN
jgi:putative Mn2+ efflux pump MntP